MTGRPIRTYSDFEHPFSKRCSPELCRLADPGPRTASGCGLGAAPAAVAGLSKDVMPNKLGTTTLALEALGIPLSLSRIPESYGDSN